MLVLIDYRLQPRIKKKRFWYVHFIVRGLWLYILELRVNMWPPNTGFQNFLQKRLSIQAYSYNIERIWKEQNNFVLLNHIKSILNYKYSNHLCYVQFSYNYQKNQQDPANVLWSNNKLLDSNKNLIILYSML